MKSIKPALSILLALASLLLIAPAAGADDDPPPLYSNHPELLPSLGEHRPRLAEVWYPHILAAGLHGVAPGAEMVILDHEEFAPAEAEQYAKIINAARAASPVPVGIYAYAGRPYSRFAWLASAEAYVANEDGTAPATESWRLANLAKEEQLLESAKADVEQQRPAAAAADIIGPVLYPRYRHSPEMAYQVASAQLADAKAEAAAAEAWAKANIKYYRPRGPRRIVAFVSPNLAGVFGGELVDEAQTDAILRACVDASVSPLIWMAQPERPERAASVSAAKRMSLRYIELIEAKAAGREPPPLPRCVAAD